MIYITGDTHGRNDVYKLRYNTTLSTLNKEDYLIIAGDFGGVWDGNWQDRIVQQFYEEQPYTKGSMPQLLPQMQRPGSKPVTVNTL